MTSNPWLSSIGARTATLLAIAAATSCAAPKAGAAAPSDVAPAELLPIGAAAPDVEGKDARGATVRLSALGGKPAVVYFYPKDDTPGCTKEACAFRDAFDKFSAAGVTIFGVSRDPETSHRAFQEKHALPFPLVADPSGSVQRAYRVPSKPGRPDVAARVTFLVGRDGKVARVWPDVDPVLHAAEVLDAVRALGSRPPRKP